MEAALSSKEENAASKTPQEVRDLLKEAILASAPVDDEADLDDKFKMEDLREEAGQNSVEEVILFGQMMSQTLWFGFDFFAFDLDVRLRRRRR